MPPTLALELGCEELPARDAAAAVDQLERVFPARLAELGLAHGPIEVLGTPRRLVVVARQLAASAADAVEEFRGPPASAAFDADGHPTRAALGFARGRGVEVSDLTVRDDGSGEYVYARVLRRGEPAAAVLSGMLPGLVAGLSFPRTMFWGPELRFPRPLRWVLALLDDSVLELELAGLRASRTTWGHRALAPGPQEVAHADRLLETLAEARVMAGPGQRRAEIGAGLQREAALLGGSAVVPADLLEEVTYLVEWPRVFGGSFDPDFTRLPRPVLETTMKVHQRFFPVAAATGELLPHFLAVRNGDDHQLDAVRRGNQRVLSARLADASYFFAADRQRWPAAMAADLEGLVFMEGLGTMADKARRLERLAPVAGRLWGLEAGQVELLGRAAACCKLDLASMLVGELPELQGVMGGQYAALAGEEPAVCEAIAQHYLPAGAGGALPDSVLGRVLAVLDRADTLAGCFGAGLRPSGSQDPYALRRAAAGIVEVLLDSHVHLPLEQLVGEAAANHGLAGDRAQDVARELLEFFGARLRALLLERGFRYDVVDAVLAAGAGDIYGAWLRLEAAAAYLEREGTGEVLALHRRALNLSGRLSGAAAAGAVCPGLFEAAAERRLLELLERVEGELAPRLEVHDYAGALELLERLPGPVEDFFQAVLVMAEDQRLRDNRLLLLGRVAALVGAVADWSQVVR